MNTGTLLKVGDKFELFQERYNSLNDGCYVEALEDGGGFIMVVYLGGISPEEKDLLRFENIHARMIRHENKILFINRYGESPLMFEVTFDPTLYKDDRAMQIAFSNHMLTIIGVERSNNTIQTLRIANFPLKLKQALATAWKSAYEEENYSKNYSDWTRFLYNYDSFQLWENAEETGDFGEEGIRND